MTTIDPMLLDIPIQFETERLIIRAPRPDEGPEVNAAVLESLEELRLWMPWARNAPTLDESKAYARASTIRWLKREELGLGLFRRSDGLFVGRSGLHNLHWDVPSFETGYWVRTSMRGNGYITEAARGITTFAMQILKARRIEIRCDARNVRSASVARRCGYVLEAKHRHDCRAPDGSLRDTLVFSLLRAEWQEIMASEAASKWHIRLSAEQ